MTDDESTRIEVGRCSKCGRALKVKPHGLRESMHLTCKCGEVNTVSVDREILIQFGVIKPHVEEDIFQIGRTPLYRLLDGPRLRAKWAEADAKNAERWKDLPPARRPPPDDIISVSMNPYQLEQNARSALNTVVKRLRNMPDARPWSVELYENVECSIRGLLGAPFFAFVAMTEMSEGAGIDTYHAFIQVVDGQRSDDRRARSGGEWEIYSQYQGNIWRGDRCARLIERWVFLDREDMRTFGLTSPKALEPQTASPADSMAEKKQAFAAGTAAEPKKGFFQNLFGKKGKST